MSRFRYFFRRAQFKFSQMFWVRRVDGARRVLAGDQAWQKMDRMGTQGLGTELLRLDFLSDSSSIPALGSTSAVHARLTAIIDYDDAPQAACFARILAHVGVLGPWRLGGTRGIEILLPGVRLETRADAPAAISPPLRAIAASSTRFSRFWMRRL